MYSAHALPRAHRLPLLRLLALVVLTPLLSIGTALVTPLSPQLAALAFHALLAEAVPTVAALPGKTVVASVRYRNIGLAPWLRGVAGRQVNLGVRGDSAQFADGKIAVGWLSPNRIATTDEDTVLPGQVGTFTFSVRAPDAVGVYPIPLRLVVDGLTRGRWIEPLARQRLRLPQPARRSIPPSDPAARGDEQPADRATAEHRDACVAARRSEPAGQSGPRGR